MDDLIKNYIDGAIQKATAFSTAKYGDTPTDALQLANKNYVDNAFNPYSSSVLTLTNKRITPRIASTVGSSGTVTINSDTTDCYYAQAITGTVTFNTSGTPTDFQKLLVRVKDNGTAQTVGWGANFKQYGASLPSVTTVSSVLTIGVIYDINASAWGCVAVAEQ